MKKTAIYYFSLAAILAGGFSSCREADLGFSAEEIARAKFEKEYNENFEREYGKIAPGHTWGFENGAFSRGTRSSEAATRYKLEQCYDDTGNFYEENKPNWQDPETGEWHLNEKYVWKCKPSIISGSVGTEDTNERIFAGEHYPGHVSQAEKEYVFWYLRTNPNKGTTSCPLDNYFMQDLHQDPFPSSSTDDNIATEHCPGWGFMNNLHFDQEHFNDFNGTSYSPDYYVVHTNVQNPYYEDSWGTNGERGTARENRFRYYYIPAFTGKIPANQTSTGNEISIDYPGGYYLCFDYESYKMDGETKNYCPFGKPDGIYNDWVIKLTAGQYDTWRVFCEDLGSTLDLDFNDLVFDYVDYGQGLEVNILAMVGTLKLNMIVGTDTENIKPGNAIQESVNKKYYFEGSTINNVKIQVETVDGKGSCFIANTPGRAPYLLKVAAGTAWPAENQRIERKYPRFTDYVKAPGTNEDWWNNFVNYPDITPGRN